MMFEKLLERLEELNSAIMDQNHVLIPERSTYLKHKARNGKETLKND